MRVLLLHNRYRAPGGEERSVADLAALLAARGHAVVVLERASARAGRGRAAISLLRGGHDPDQVAGAVRRLGADVVHAHNLHPLLGWRALAAAAQAGARTVLHLHNFRLFCAIGVAYRDGAPCHRCRGRDTMPGLRLRCRGDLVEAAVYAAALYSQQPHLLQSADRFVIPSRATARRLIELGLPGDRAAVLPNFIPDRAFAPRSRADQGEYVLVAGRLVEEKGFDTAVSAARRARVPLVVTGEGPDLPRLRQLAAGAEVRFTGRVSAQELKQLRDGAAMVLAPSRSEESCPYSVLEALSAGLPVLASDLGGLPELVEEDQALPAGDADAWAEAVSSYWRDPQARRRRGEQALARARHRFAEAPYYDALMEIYRSTAPA